MSSLTIHELPKQDRPREKLAALGASALSESELIAILLRTGLRGCNAVDLARDLLARYKSLAALSRCGVKELAAIKGIGMAKAVQLAAAFGLGSRLAQEKLARSKIDSPQLVYDLLGAEMRALNRESLRIVLLDTRYHLLRIEEISLGSLNESIAHPREIFRPAIIHSAYAIIVAHNHPSGDPTPSEADHRLTRRLAEAAQLLQIQLCDHVIIGSPGENRTPYFSFKESGVL
jgi:DNA repair protein RadC